MNEIPPAPAICVWCGEPGLLLATSEGLYHVGCVTTAAQTKRWVGSLPDESAAKAQAFAACEAIEDGSWDALLRLLWESIIRRQQTAEYKAWALAAAELRAKR